MEVKNIDKYELSDFTGGWFVGDFENSLLRTNFEASVKHHPKGEVWDKHYHKKATEYNVVVSGCVVIDNVRYEKDSVFVIHPYFVVDPNFVEDTTIVCIKSISDVNDKYVVER